MLLLLLLVPVARPEHKWSMDSDLEMDRLRFWNAAKPFSELTEWRNGIIWPRKKTSSATHISGSAETEPGHDPKLKSSIADGADASSLDWLVSSRLRGRSDRDKASSSSECAHFSSSAVVEAIGL